MRNTLVEAVAYAVAFPARIVGNWIKPKKADVKNE